jgi:hypothetical protein
MNANVVGVLVSISSTAVAVIAAVIAYFSWRTSKEAATANAALAEIEKKRLYVELRPQFDLELERVATEVAVLTIHLVGPNGIRWIDINLKVRQRGRNFSQDKSGTGPWLISNSVDDLWSSETETLTFRLVPGDEQWIAMETAPGRSEYDLHHEKARFWLACTSSDGESWNVPASVLLFDPIGSKPNYLSDDNPPF